jgi:Kef-type K+ transport system membrane component KefB/nucleotide-binding universal stress UspA family protein
VTPLSEVQILRFILEIAVLLLASRVLADVAKRLGQAAVIGELLAGVVLGPSVLGRLAPALYALIFPHDQVVAHLVEGVAWLGVIMLLLYIGLETDLSILSGMGRTAVLVSAFGMVIPFACGLGLGLSLPAHYLAAPNQRLIFALFMAVAVAISAVPVIAKILIDLGLLHRDLGLLILAAGIVDDTTGWLLLSLVAGLAQRGSVNPFSFAILVGSALAFLAFCYFAGYRLMARLLRWVDDRTYVEHGKLSAMIIIALGCAFVTQAIGVHAVFGAFIAGVMLGNGSARVRKQDRDELEALTLGFLAPIFFAYSGLKADVSTLSDPLIPAIVLAIACGAKFIGAGAGGLFGGLKWREAMAVAIGMNARGGMEVLAALIGLSLGVLTPQMYTVVILVAIVTSVITPGLLSWSLSEVEERPSDAQRQEREQLLKGLEIKAEGTKLLVLSGGGPHAALATHMAAALANHPEASITIFRAYTGNDNGRRNDAFNDEFAKLEEVARFGGAQHIHQRSASGETITEAITEEIQRGYDAVFVGASELAGKEVIGGEMLRQLVNAARAPVVIVRSGKTIAPFRRVLTPITGASFSRLGATVAMQYAQVFKSRVTALYVHEGPMLSFRSRAGVEEGEEFVQEVRKLGVELGVDMETLVGSGRKPENVILSAAHNGNYDLLVMGVLFRSSEQRIYFGPRVREVLRGARCSVALVVPPHQSLPES